MTLDEVKLVKFNLFLKGDPVVASNLTLKRAYQHLTMNGA